MPACSWGCAAERVAGGWNGGLGTMYISSLSSQGVQVATSYCTGIKKRNSVRWHRQKGLILSGLTSWVQTTHFHFTDETYI